MVCIFTYGKNACSFSHTVEEIFDLCCNSLSHAFFGAWLATHFFNFGGSYAYLRVSIQTRRRFGKADFRSSFVKILGNTYSISCVFVVAEQKSALPKIFDRKVRRF